MPEKLENIKNKFKDIVDSINKHKIADYASQCAFFTILSFIPFIILLITLIQYINIDQITVIDTIQKILPQSFREFIVNMIQEIYSKSIGTISISIIFILWSAGKGFYTISKGLEQIYEIPKTKNFIYLKLKSLLYTIGFIGVVVAVLLLLVFGNQIKLLLIKNIPQIGNFLQSIEIYTDILIYLILFITFLLMYKFVPNHKVKLTSQVRGALFAALSWGIISYIFSTYLQIFSGFSIIYGSLTTAMLLLIWVYICMYAILLGAEINYSYNKKNK